MFLAHLHLCHPLAWLVKSSLCFKIHQYHSNETASLTEFSGGGVLSLITLKGLIHRLRASASNPL